MFQKIGNDYRALRDVYATQLRSVEDYEEYGTYIDPLPAIYEPHPKSVVVFKTILNLAAPLDYINLKISIPDDE